MAMSHSVRDPALEQIVDTMIDLTRLSDAQRVVLGGDDSVGVYLALRDRGFSRAATIASCRVAGAQFQVGLMAGRHSLQALETHLAKISHYLGATSAIAVSIDSREGVPSLKIRAGLERLGFRIEAGVRCRQGLVLSAYRQGYGEMRNAA
jgi:hypothetical protein